MLHTRFALGDDVLKPYKTTIERWLSPEVFRGQDVTVSEVKKAIADLKKTGDQPANSAEWMVLNCGRATGLSAEDDADDAVYLDAWVSMFGQALTAIASLPVAIQDAMVNRLENVQPIARDLGYGVAEALDTLWRGHDRA